MLSGLGGDAIALSIVFRYPENSWRRDWHKPMEEKKVDGATV